MEKLLEQIKKELKDIEDKGLTASNLDLAGKLVDLQKDLCEIQKMDKGGSHEMYGDRYYNTRFYRDGGGYGEGYSRRGGGRYSNPMRDYMDRAYEGMEDYEYGRERYMHGGGEERILEGLDRMMHAVCMVVESAMEFAETPQEKEIVRKHVQKMSRV